MNTRNYHREAAKPKDRTDVRFDIGLLLLLLALVGLIAIFYGD